MGISGCKSELLQCPLDFAPVARKVPGFIPHGVFFGIPKLINLLQGHEPLGVARAGGRQARTFVPLGFQRLTELAHGGSGLAAISHGNSDAAGATERLDEPLDSSPAVALRALNPWKPHLSYDLERADGGESGDEQAQQQVTGSTANLAAALQGGGRGAWHNVRIAVVPRPALSQTVAVGALTTGPPSSIVSQEFETPETRRICVVYRRICD